MLAALCITTLVGCGAAPTRFEFAVIGDQQYNTESAAQFPRLMEGVNRSNVAFVVHLGDFKASRSGHCDDELYKARMEQFNASRHPLIYTPGDNDWTDCHHPQAGGYKPTEALGRLRRIFFPDNRSLGREKIALQRQSSDPRYGQFRENARWYRGGVLFATIHMVGENNNLGRTAEDDAEYRERNGANLAWLEECFAAAREQGADAVVLVAHANPRFERDFPRGRIRAIGLRGAPAQPSGFNDFLASLRREVRAYGKPVVLIHGDTHYFRVDKPMFTAETSSGTDLGRQVENFTRVEVVGFPDAHWVRITVDPSDRGVFFVRQEIVESNRFPGH
jgi:hypothetical protein